MKCYECGGSGKCPDCRGLGLKGTIVCSQCGGKGICHLCGSARGIRSQTPSKSSVYKVTVRNSIAGLGVLSAGFLTSVATALALFLIVRFLHFAVYGFMWYVVPVGAFFSGIAATSGYYYAARFLKFRASRLVVCVEMIVMSVGTYFLIFFCNYYFLEANGRYVRDVIGFPEFLDLVTKQASVTLWPFLPSTGPLGGIGYGLLVLQLSGFVGGGLHLYSKLLDEGYCDSCGLYLDVRSHNARYAENLSEIVSLFVNLDSLNKTMGIQACVSRYAGWGHADPTPGSRVRAECHISQCGTCEAEWVQIFANELKGVKWKAITNLQIKGFSIRSLSLEPGVSAQDPKVST